MSTASDHQQSPRRDGAGTRSAVQRVALELFTSQGYASTSLREIAERVGINKASLYYHFAGKEDILRSLFSERGSEVDDLTAWLAEQPADPGLVRTTVLRWVGSFSAAKLAGIRFLAANPLVARAVEADGERIGDGLNRLADRLAGLLPTPGGADVVLLRMALLSINAAVEASAGSGVDDEEVVLAAYRAAEALVEQLLGAGAPPTSRPALG